MRHFQLMPVATCDIEGHTCIKKAICPCCGEVTRVVWNKPNRRILWVVIGCEHYAGNELRSLRWEWDT